MKKTTLLLSLIFFVAFSFAQEKTSKMPEVQVKNLDKQAFNTKDIDNDGKSEKILLTPTNIRRSITPHQRL